MDSPLKIALVGGGFFARDNHAPALLALQPFFSVVAVWSHSQEGAEKVASLFPSYDFHLIMFIGL